MDVPSRTRFAILSPATPPSAPERRGAPSESRSMQWWPPTDGELSAIEQFYFVGWDDA